MTTATASSTVAATIAAGAMPAGSEVSPTESAGHLGFATLVTEALDTSGRATPGRCEGGMPQGEIKPPRRAGTEQDELADALVLAGQFPAWVIPAPKPAATQETIVSGASSIGLSGIAGPAQSELIQQSPVAGGSILPASGARLELGSAGQGNPLAGQARPQPSSVTANPGMRPPAPAWAGADGRLSAKTGERAIAWEDLELPAVVFGGALVTNQKSEVIPGPGVVSSPKPALTEIQPVALEPQSAVHPPVVRLGAQLEHTPAQPSFMRFNSMTGLTLDQGTNPTLDIATAASEVAPAAVPPADRPSTPQPRRLASAAEAKFVELEPPPLPSSVKPPTALAGTGTAELGLGMKNATEPKQFAGLAQQNLPELVVASEAVAPELWRRGGTRSGLVTGATETRPDATAQLISPLSPDQPAFRTAEELVAPPATATTNSPAPTESLQSSVLKHVTELRHTGATEMAVVLKPDAETQLSLRLTMDSNGEVTVQARCEQGDAQMLAANWGEIRHSLAQQGVRLGALEFSPERGHDTFQPHAGNGGPSPDGQPSSQRRGQPWPETLDDLPLTGSLTEPLTRRGVPRPPAGRTRLLESWA